jgi:hypothetical protein
MAKPEEQPYSKLHKEKVSEKHEKSISSTHWECYLRIWRFPCCLSMLTAQRSIAPSPHYSPLLLLLFLLWEPSSTTMSYSYLFKYIIIGDTGEIKYLEMAKFERTREIFAPVESRENFCAQSLIVASRLLSSIRNNISICHEFKESVEWLKPPNVFLFL